MLYPKTFEITKEKRLESKMKRLTVITVTFNAESCVEKTLRSVIGQTVFDEQIEYIVVDGASKDGTMRIVNQYREKLAHVVSEPDKGIYDAMNKGIRLASAPWICFMNADDTFYDEATVEHLKLQEKEDNAILYGDALWENSITHKKEVRKAVPFFENPDKCSGLGICHQATITPTAWMKQMPFDISRFRYCNDYEFFFKQWHDEHHHFCYVGQPLCRFTYGDGWSSSANVSRKIFEENAAISHTRYGYWYWRHLWRIYKRKWLNR